jgi:hypothetical protein
MVRVLASFIFSANVTTQREGYQVAVYKYKSKGDAPHGFK